MIFEKKKKNKAGGHTTGGSLITFEKLHGHLDETKWNTVTMMENLGDVVAAAMAALRLLLLFWPGPTSL